MYSFIIPLSYFIPKWNCIFSVSQFLNWLSHHHFYNKNKRVIFIDAVETGKAPGAITTFTSKDVRSIYPKKKSMNV